MDAAGRMVLACHWRMAGRSDLVPAVDAARRRSATRAWPGTCCAPVRMGCPCWTACPISTSRRCTTGCLNSSSRRAASVAGPTAVLDGRLGHVDRAVFFVLRHRDRATATMTTLILACMPFFYGGAQFANLDMLVAGMISLCAGRGRDRAAGRAGQAYRVMSLVAALAGLAVLAKGLIGLVLPGAVLFIWLVAGRLARPEGVGSARAAAVRGGRGAVVLADADAFLGLYDYFFVYQHFQRFAATGFNNAQPFWFYLPVIVARAAVVPWGGGSCARRSGPGRRASCDCWRPSGPWSSWRSFAAGVQAGGLVLPTRRRWPSCWPRWWWPPGATSTTRSRPGWCASAPAPALSSACWRWVSPDTTPGAARSPWPVIRPQLQADDTFVSLHAYPSTWRSTCARSSRPVDDWLNPEIARVTTGARSCMTPPSSIRRGQAGVDQQ